MSAEHIFSATPIVFPVGVLPRIVESMRRLGRRLAESGGDLAAGERLAHLEAQLAAHTVMTVDFAWYVYFAWSTSPDDRELVGPLMLDMILSGFTQIAQQLDQAWKDEWISYESAIMEARLLLGKREELGDKFGTYILSHEGLSMFVSIATHYGMVIPEIIRKLPESASLEGISRIRRMAPVMLNMAKMAEQLRGET